MRIMALILTSLLSCDMIAIKGLNYRQSTLLKANLYPSQKTPGLNIPSITKEQICTPGYARNARNVSGKTKREVKFRYKIPTEHHPYYTIDHFIPLSLGGSNSISNLWPQPTRGIEFGAEQKAQSDAYLHSRVCEGIISLEEAQKLVKTDWILVYKECCTKAVNRWK